MFEYTNSTYLMSEIRDSEIKTYQLRMQYQHQYREQQRKQQYQEKQFQNKEQIQDIEKHKQIKKI